MSADNLLADLKSALAKRHPNLAGVFTDRQLAGMLDESREWCLPNCTDEEHRHVNHAVNIAVRVAEEQELGAKKG